MVHCAAFERACPTPEEVSAIAGLRGDPEAFREISQADAIEIAALILHEDLAYRIELMPPGDAKALATEFIAQFTAPARYFTNGEFVGRSLSAFEPITEATLDTGIIVLGSSSAGILWVEDED